MADTGQCERSGRIRRRICRRDTLKAYRLGMLHTMTTRFSRLWLAAVSSLTLMGVSAAAQAETLAEAVALAYQSNPQLQSQRAIQRQLDESYVQARAGFRPSASASGSASYTEIDGPDRNSLGVNATATQPLYTGGRVSAAVNAAEATVLAGRQSLRVTEQTILQSVVQAYVDVLRDQQIVAIRQQSVTVLGSQFEETGARFEAGLLTRTDVARAEAQLAASRAQLTSAQAQLQISRAAYATAVGQNPGELIQPTTLPNLPADVSQAFAAAEDNNPNLRRAQIAEQASRYRVAQVRAQRNPTVSLQASAGYSGLADPFGSFNHELRASVVASQPLFTGGVTSSQIRSALEQNNSDRILIEQARRAAVQAVSQAWNQMLAAQGNITSNDQAVNAATVAFEGAQEQYRVGLSTTLDVLLAQESLRTAQLSRVQAQRDLYVSQASLLNAMGRLDAASLIQGAELYDPSVSFDRVRNSGAVPWEHLVESLDAIGGSRPADPSRPIPTPALSTGPVTLNPALQVPSSAEGAAFSTSVPTSQIAPLPTGAVDR
jgi:outer membrane protein